MILDGDCLEVMQIFDDNTFSGMITDPPYGLKFMGKKWDYEVPKVEVWQECLRVLKPGAHALVACGTRTQHRMAVNLEDAGFEIRDLVAWVYGSGFPKSMDISKAIDKAAGVERTATKEGVIKRDGYGEDWDTGSSDSRPRYDEPATPEAKLWQGYGTALKPAMELWTLCRKPLSEKTVAANVLKWGCGGINIDGGRVPVDPRVDDMLRTTTRAKRISETWETGSGFKNETNSLTGVPETGRFPANLIHDGGEEVLAGFPDSKGQIARVGPEHGYKNSINCYGDYPPRNDCEPRGDSGSAARFFYCAKASKSERNLNGATNRHPTVKPLALMRYLTRLIKQPADNLILDPFCGSGSTIIGAELEGCECIGIEMDAVSANLARHRTDTTED